MDEDRNRIKERRESLGLSREVLAGLVGTSSTQIWRYEKGENDPTGTVLVKLARALRTSTDWLLGVLDDLPEERLDNLEKEALEVLRSKDVERRHAIVEIMKIAR